MKQFGYISVTDKISGSLKIQKRVFFIISYLVHILKDHSDEHMVAVFIFYSFLIPCQGDDSAASDNYEEKILGG